MTASNHPDAKALIARVQRLADTPRPEAGHPLVWQVEAFFLGDAHAIAAAAIRAARG